MFTNQRSRFHEMQDWFFIERSSRGEFTPIVKMDATASSVDTITYSESRNSIIHPKNIRPLSVRFRPILPHDRQAVQCLHEDWFPVVYQDDFYDDLVTNGQQHWLHSSPTEQPKSAIIACSPKKAMNRSLFTCLAVREDEENCSRLACVVGCFLSASQMPSQLQELLLPAQLDKKAFYIMTLGVVPSWRQSGLGSHLVQICEELVQNDVDCNVLYLHVITFNHGAIRLYQKLGFYRVEEIEDYYAIDGKHFDAYLFAKYFHGNRGHRDLISFLKETASFFWEHTVTSIPKLILQFLPGRQRTIYTFLTRFTRRRSVG